MTTPTEPNVEAKLAGDLRGALCACGQASSSLLERLIDQATLLLERLWLWHWNRTRKAGSR